MTRIRGHVGPTELATRASHARLAEAGDSAAARDLLVKLLPEMQQVLGLEHPNSQAVQQYVGDRTWEAQSAG